MHKVCKECTTQYAVDADVCPNCGHDEWRTPLEHEEQNMGKISVPSGLTDQATGVGFSGDPDDERAAGNRVAERTSEEAQTAGPTGNQLLAAQDPDRREPDGDEDTQENEGGTPDDDAPEARNMADEGEREAADDTQHGYEGSALPPVETDADGTDTGEERLSDAGKYADWSKQDLQDEASRRGLSGAGTKADITQRLLEDDRSRESEPGA